jgi:hypothetical protein
MPLPLACRSAIVDALSDDADTTAALAEVVAAVVGDGAGDDGGSARRAGPAAAATPVGGLHLLRKAMGRGR